MKDITVIEKIIRRLELRLECSEKITQGLGADESAWRQGLEAGLQTTIEMIKNEFITETPKK